MSEPIIARFREEGLQELTSDLQKASDKMDLFAKAHAIVSENSENLSKKQLELREQINSTGGVLQKMNESGRTTTTLYAEMQKQLTLLVAEYSSLEKQTKQTNVTQVDHEKILKQVADGQISARTGMKQLREEMVRLAAQGKTNTEQYKSLRNTAGELKDILGDVAQEAKAAGSDTRGIDNLVRSVNLGVNSVTALQGAYALFGGENKEFEKTLLKLNAAMLLTNSLQQIGEELTRKDSVAKKAAAQATALYNVVVGESTGMLKAFRIALAATGIGLLIIGITTLIANFDRLTKSGGIVADTFNAIGNVISKIIQSYKDLSDAIGLTDFAGEKAAQDEADRRQLALEQMERDAKTRIAIMKIQHKETAEAELAELKRQAKLADEARRQAKINDDKDAKQKNDAYLDLIEEIKIKEAEIAQIKIDNAEKSAKDAEKKEMDRLKKLQAQKEKEIKEHLERVAKLRQKSVELIDQIEKREAEAAAVRRQVEDARALQELRDRTAREISIRDQNYIAQQKEELLLRQARADREAAEIQRMRDEQQRLEQQRQDRINLAAAAGSAIFSIEKQLVDYKQSILDDQLSKGLISEKKYQQEVRALKRKEAIAAKAEAAFNISISIAEAIVKALAKGPIVGQVLAGITAALGFAQLAFVLSRPIPQFREGGSVAKRLGLIQGPSHERGGVPIEVEGREYVMPVKQTTKYLPVLEAMREGYFERMNIPVEKILRPDLPASINVNAFASKNFTGAAGDQKLNKQLDKMLQELGFIGAYIKTGNKDRVRGTQQLSKVIEKLNVNGY